MGSKQDKTKRLLQKNMAGTDLEVCTSPFFDQVRLLFGIISYCCSLKSSLRNRQSRLWSARRRKEAEQPELH